MSITDTKSRVAPAEIQAFMQIMHSFRQPDAAPEAEISVALELVSPANLRRHVEALSFPRHAEINAAANRRAAHLIADELASYGYKVRFAGAQRNVCALPANLEQPVIIVGAHYDSVPQTPGADDNASALAALLECARIAAKFQNENLCFVAFNREEDGLLGSREFVQGFLPQLNWKIAGAHILEMVGFCSHEAESQQTPPNLPISIPSIGDFLGLIGNANSAALVDAALQNARTYAPDFPVLGLKVPAGAENFLPVLARSDHAPFWEAGLPALMWTDTSEFRNPHYHQSTDTPETLDYDFLRAATRVLLACLLASQGEV